MKTKKWAALLAALMVLCMALTGCDGLGGGPSQQKAADSKEAADHFLTDIKNGDYEAASSYLLEGNRLFRVFAAKDGESVPMLDEVYKKVMSQMGDFTYTLEDGPASDCITVKFQGKDCGASIHAAMDQAIQEQTQNGGDAFTDITGWLTTGLENAETAEEQEYQCIMTKKSGRYHMGHTSYGEIALLNAITCGFYDYTKLTMTTCTSTEDGVEYKEYIAALGDTMIASVETMTEKLDAPLTDEEKEMMRQSVFADLQGLDGVYTGVYFNDDNTVTMSLGIDYNTASSFVLADLGIVSGKYISNGTNNLSLSATLQGYEADGTVWETQPQYDAPSK